VNNLYFACTECKIFVDAGYRWAYWNLAEPGVVDSRMDVDVERVLNAADYWAPPHEPNSNWLYDDVLPSVRQFLSDHRRHRIVFWESNDLPGDYLLEWLQIGYCPLPTARFFAETLRLRDWAAVLNYDKAVYEHGLEALLYDEAQVTAFRKAFCRWSEAAAP